jgi:hypothetical protein
MFDYRRGMSVTNTVTAKKWAATLDDIKKKAYWVVGALLVFGISYFYYSGLNRPVAGVLWFIGGGVILFYYWIKWFLSPVPPDPDFNPGTLACPDYLSVVPPGEFYRPTSKSQYYCVDYIGVSRNGKLKKMNPVQLKQKISDPNYRFSVDPAVDFKDSSGKMAFMKRLVAAGLSYNSVGDSSLPTMGDNSNGAPLFTGLQSGNMAPVHA